MLIKAIASLIALTAAAVCVVFPPASGVIITSVVPVVAGIAGQLGMANWRNKFGEAKTLLESKTKIGVLMIVLPIIALAVFPLVGFEPAEWLRYLLVGLIAGGGGNTLLGMFDVTKQEQKSIEKL